MNDPWSTLVETLSGSKHKTPANWPQRKVHRMMDDTPSNVLVPKPLPPLRNLQPGPPAHR